MIIHRVIYKDQNGDAYEFIRTDKKDYANEIFDLLSKICVMHHETMDTQDTSKVAPFNLNDRFSRLTRKYISDKILYINNCVWHLKQQADKVNEPINIESVENSIAALELHLGGIKRILKTTL